MNIPIGPDIDPVWVEPVKGVGVLTIPKCASSSMKKMTKGAAKSLKRDTIPKRMIVFVRDPIERLESAYRFFSKSRSNKFNATWFELVDAVLNGHPNIHWMPQTRYIENFPGIEAYPFECLATVWRALFGTELTWANPSDPMDLAGYRIDELKEHYREDYQWRK